MANKKLGTVASELRLPTKKVKGDKKPKWQAKTGNKAKGQGSEVQDSVAQEVPSTPPEPTETPVVATTLEPASVEPTTTDDAVTTHDVAMLAEQTTIEPAASDEATVKKPRKLKVQADAPPRKLSMIAAALQVLQDRKVAMTCPELIDVMATEGLWSSPGGKTPANTLYAAISRIIKEKGEESPFRKGERGRFEAV